MKKWETMFENAFLSKGKTLYETGFFSLRKMNEDTYTATIEDDFKYEPMVTIKDGRIQDMHCKCRNFCFKKQCAHITALLYEIDDICKIEIEEENSTNLIDNEVNKRSNKKNYFETNLLSSHSVQVNNQNIPQTTTQMKVELNDIFDTYKHYGIIESEWCEDYCTNVMDVLDDSVQFLLNTNKFLEAIQMIDCVIQEFDLIDIESDENSIYQAMENCFNCWGIVLNNANQEVVEKLLLPLQKYACSKGSYEQHEEVKKMILNKCEAPLYSKLVTFCERVIQHLRKNPNVDSNDLIEMWIKIEIELANRMGDKKLIDNLYHSYQDIEVIKKFKFNNILKNGDYEILKQFLNELKKERFVYEVCALRDKIKIIYTSHQDEYQKLLERLLFEFHIIDYKLYLEYRSLHSKEEWNQKKSNILETYEFDRISPKIYKLEKRYDLLLAYTLEKGHDLLKYFIDDLKDYYPNELLAFYKTRFLEMIEIRTNPYGYPKIMENLAIMTMVPGGQEFVEILVNETIKRYPNRKKMNQQFMLILERNKKMVKDI